jgi:16S rRNA (uracil1498-N3)-methyltransferase
MRDGDSLTVSDGRGSWRTATFHPGGELRPTGEVYIVAEITTPLTVAFALVKGSRPEMVIQKLTELGIDQIVVLAAERSIVKWDDDKAVKARSRWERIVREAGMQSHRVRLPDVRAVVPALEWLARPEVAIAHFGGHRLGEEHTSIAIGPEGGWSNAEVELATNSVTLGSTVLRAETAAIAAGTLLTAAGRGYQSDVG